MSRPLVAIVGRPNVGKSMLFNRLVGQRLSIVEDTPGVTRDRLYAPCEWCGRTFDMVDTGGIEPTTDSEILLFMREQAKIAIDTATVIVLVTDIRTGVTAADKDVANMLLRSRKPVVLAVNKADSTGSEDPALYEFYELGMGDPIPVSAVHGHGTGDLLDACLEHFPDEDEEDDDRDCIKVAVIGKPNVGKSSLINHILGEKRLIVSDMAGTTRDAVDTIYENELGRYMFIDTAGIRRKSKVEERVEKFSVMRSQLAIERADVCLIMIDAREGVTEQDTKIAGLAHEAGKASIVINNCLKDSDCNLFQPLHIAFDANSAICEVCVGQPNEEKREMRTINSMYVKTPLKLQDLVEKFCEYYQPMTCRDVVFYFDTTFIWTSGTTDQSYADVITDVLKQNHFNVIQVHTGNPVRHDWKHMQIDLALKGDPKFLFPLFNLENNEYLKIAMERTGIKQGRNGFEKDKSCEKTPDTKDNPDEYKTHITDAWDELFLGMNFYSKTMQNYDVDIYMLQNN